MVVVPRAEGWPLFKGAEERLVKAARGDDMDVKCAKVQKIKRKVQFSSDEETSQQKSKSSKKKKSENKRLEEFAKKCEQKKKNKYKSARQEVRFCPEYFLKPFFNFLKNVKLFFTVC